MKEKIHFIVDKSIIALMDKKRNQICPTIQQIKNR